MFARSKARFFLITCCLLSSTLSLEATKSTLNDSKEDFYNAKALYQTLGSSVPGKRPHTAMTKELENAVWKVSGLEKISEADDAQITAAKTNPDLSMVDFFSLCLTQVAKGQSEWQKGDKEIIRLFPALPGAEHLYFDPDFSKPQEAASSVANQLFFPRENSLRWQTLSDQTLILPVFSGNTLFSPDLLAEFSISNLYFLGVMKQETTSIHGLQVSKFGQVLHDLAHALNALQVKEIAYRKSHQALFKGLPLPEMSFEEMDDLEKQVAAYWVRKNQLFESGLVSALNQWQKDEKKPAMAAMLLFSHEVGIFAWPSPASLSSDFKSVLQDAFLKAKQVIEGYYLKNTSQTRYQDGEPQWKELPEDLKKECSIPEGAVTKTQNHGSTLFVHWKKDAHTGTKAVLTNQWLKNEAMDGQKLLKWAFGAEHEYKMPDLTPQSTEDDIKKYVETTAKGLQACFDKAIWESQMLPDSTFKNYEAEIKEEHRKTLQQFEEAFSSKSFWTDLRNKLATSI